MNHISNCGDTDKSEGDIKGKVDRPSSPACQSQNPENAAHEYQITKDLNTKDALGNIMTMYERIEYQNNIILVSELLGRSLEKRLYRKMSLSCVQLIGQQLASGLKVFHDQGEAHCDLKPDNIAFVKGSEETNQVKIIDLGSVYFLRRGLDYIVTRYYRAPEVIHRNKPYSVAIDVWSLGCILYEIRYGSPPFLGVDEQELLHCINRKQKDLSKIMRGYEAKMDLQKENFIDFICKLLAFCPQDRPTSDQ